MSQRFDGNTLVEQAAETAEKQIMNKEIASKILRVLSGTRFEEFYQGAFADYIRGEIPVKSVPLEEQTQEILDQIEGIFNGIFPE